MQRNDKIKDLFSSKLLGYEPDLPEGIWNGIEEDLQSAEGKRNKMAIRRVLVSVAAVAAVLVLGVLIIPFGKNNIEPVSSVSPVYEERKINNPFFTRKNIEQEPAVHRHTNKVVKNNVFYAKATDQEPDICKQNPVEAVNSEIIIVAGGNEKETDEDIDLYIQDSEYAEKLAAFESLGQQDLIFTDPGYSEKKSGKGFSLALGGSSGLSDIQDKVSPTPNVIVKYALAAENTMSDNLGSPSGENGGKFPKKHVKMNHYQPFSFGVRGSKNITRDLAVESGIVYTYLHSKIKPGKNNDDIDGSLKFHYLGIPLAVNYTFARLDKAKFMVSAGGMIEKDISGNLSSNVEIGHRQELESNIYIKKNISQKNPQFSIRTNLGASYPLYSDLKIYASVGCAYYFEAGNEYRTIYSDKKLQLDLNMGVSLEF